MLENKFRLDSTWKKNPLYRTRWGPRGSINPCDWSIPDIFYYLLQTMRTRNPFILSSPQKNTGRRDFYVLGKSDVCENRPFLYCGGIGGGGGVGGGSVRRVKGEGEPTRVDLSAWQIHLSKHRTSLYCACREREGRWGNKKEEKIYVKYYMLMPRSRYCTLR